jgi:predicted negative regulator of RcsB-dependent stress response
MNNKALLSTIVSLLIVIAGYLGYLAWNRHQHDMQEAAEHRQELEFKAHLLGTTPEKLEQEETPEQRQADKEANEAVRKAMQQ